MKAKLLKIKNFILDKDKKSYFLITKEVLELWKQDNGFPMHYFTRLAYKKNSSHYKYFTKFALINKLWHSNKLHTEKTIEILDNKIKFNRFCTNNSIPTPTMLAYNEGMNFFMEDKEIIVKDRISFESILNQLIHMSKTKSIFLKPIDGMQGKGCYRLQEEELKNNSKIDELFDVLSISKYIIQETITQHPVLDKINPYSINTIRMDTYIKEDGTVEVLSAIMRFGRKGSVVDNSSSGGFFVPLDLKNGCLKEYGFQLLDVGNEYIFEHPDTKVKLKGFKIPYVEESKKLVKRIASLLGDRLTGWDIAITPEGPIIIEGNHNYHIAMQEIAYGGYKRHPIFKEILEKYT